MSKNKNIKRSLYILTEGHTEQAYFSRISEILGDEDEWKYSVTVDVREIVEGSNIILANNNSKRPFIFNNAQQNIKLLDTNNAELTYAIPQAQIINAGGNGTTDIYFTINRQFQASKLKFQTTNECVYVEL